MTCKSTVSNQPQRAHFALLPLGLFTLTLPQASKFILHAIVLGGRENSLQPEGMYRYVRCGREAIYRTHTHTQLCFVAL